MYNYTDYDYMLLYSIFPFFRVIDIPSLPVCCEFHTTVIFQFNSNSNSSILKIKFPFLSISQFCIDIRSFFSSSRIRNSNLLRIISYITLLSFTLNLRVRSYQNSFKSILLFLFYFSFMITILYCASVVLLFQVFAGFLVHHEFNKGEHSSGVVFLYWMLMVIVNIVYFRTLIRRVGPFSYIKSE